VVEVKTGGKQIATAARPGTTRRYEVIGWYHDMTSMSVLMLEQLPVERKIQAPLQACWPLFLFMGCAVIDGQVL
jgi:hypothetical protein